MRILGAAVVMLASCGVGFQTLYRRRRRMRCLRGMEDALTLLSGELSGKRSPLPDLIREGSLYASGEARAFFMSLSASLCQLGSKCFSELWEDAAENVPLLKAEERCELISLGRQLGRTELSRQLASLDACCRFFLLRLEKEEQALQNDRRLLLGIPAATGALLSILLL